MTAEEQRLIREHQARLASMSGDERDAYLAEREEADRLAEVRRRQQEHRLHQLGVGLIWLATLTFAFCLGYSSHGRPIGTVAALIMALSIIGAVIGGAVIATNNRHRRDQTPNS